MAEVIISFVIVGMLAVMVMTVVSSSYLMSSQLKNLPNTYYGGQNEVETELDELRSHVRVKYRLVNEINSTADASLEPTLRSQLQEEELWLQNYATREVTLFGKEVELYQFTTEYDEGDNNKITLYAGVVNAETRERLVPILDAVTISAGGNSVEVYYGEGTTVSASVDYNEKNENYVFRTFYQWYIATSNFHTAPFSDGRRYEADAQYGGTVYSRYPDDFTLLTGETSDTITIKDEYLGHMLICVATPLSKNGRMGESMVSNELYLSALPQLSSGSYRMVIDPSMVTYDYETTGEQRVTSISSRKPASGSGLQGSAVISLDGAATGDGAYSRYLHFDETTSMRTTGFTGGMNNVLLAVARNNRRLPVDFLSAEDMDEEPISAGFQTNAMAAGAGDWKILVADLGRGTSPFTVGGADVDVAELIVLSNPSDDGIEDVLNYLANKYGIDG